MLTYNPDDKSQPNNGHSILFGYVYNNLVGGHIKTLDSHVDFQIWDCLKSQRGFYVSPMIHCFTVTETNVKHKI